MIAAARPADIWNRVEVEIYREEVRDFTPWIVTPCQGSTLNKSSSEY